ncbi:MAG: hypothetical protein V4543_17680 [Bacteroidota bacterium]
MKTYISYNRSLITKGFVAIVTLLVLLTGSANAQQSGEPGNSGPTPSGPNAQVPVDGGASLLLAAGVGYGIKKVRARRKVKADNMKAKF